MCGVLFCIDRKRRIRAQTFKDALDLQEHRGPDDSGVICLDSIDCPSKFLEFPSADFALLNGERNPQLMVGHRRLSIIDTTKQSHQPLFRQESRKFMTYNGEFYNYSDYAEPSTVHSDTLTLFGNMNRFGIDFMSRVNGMWAIVFGDLDRGEIYLSRDRYGKKPLYYYHDEDYFIASSEIKSIFHILKKARTVNQEALAFFLIGKLAPYMSNGQSFYKDIYSVKPGHCIVFSPDTHSLKSQHAYSFDDLNARKIDAADMNEKELLAQLKYDLQDSIKLRLRSDVKIGIQVSGGVDSSAIAAYVENFTGSKEDIYFYTCHIVDSDGMANEDLEFSRQVARDLNRPIVEVRADSLSHEEFLEQFSLLSRHVEIPLNIMLATTPTYLISKRMRADGVKVALDGVGGDEILGGYPSFFNLALANSVQGKWVEMTRNFFRWKEFKLLDPTAAALQFLSLVKKAILKPELNTASDQMAKYMEHIIRTPDLRKTLNNLAKEYFVRDRITHMSAIQEFEISRYQLPYYLGIADNLNMINSVENRSPFLDPRLHKYIYMNDNLKINRGYNKYLLRQAIPETISSCVRWRRGKYGMQNAYSSQLVSSKAAYECVMDSQFLRSWVKLDKVSENESTLIRQLLSLAVLDHQYQLSF